MEKIRTMQMQDRTTLHLLQQLFMPDGESQTKATLYDAKVDAAKPDGAARVADG